MPKCQSVMFTLWSLTLPNDITVALKSPRKHQPVLAETSAPGAASAGAGGARFWEGNRGVCGTSEAMPGSLPHTPNVC